MSAYAFRTTLAGAVFALVSTVTFAAADAPSAEQQRIDAAIKAYAAQVQANEEKARDQLIAGHMNALMNDPMSPVIGNPKGDSTIIEFFDYACPYCKAAEPRIEKLVKDDKRVRLVMKEFPILTPESFVATKAALASVRQGKYEAFHNTLMNFKGQLQNEVIFDAAKEVGLDLVRLKKDMEAPEITDEIIANYNLARGVRIFQTPGFIAGGHFITSDSADIDFPKLAQSARGK